LNLQAHYPDEGNYGGKCIREGNGPPTCNDPRTRCADKNDQTRCLIRAYQRCDKSTDYNTSCADDQYSCINYKIKDSSGKEVALCAPKGTYMDICSSQVQCAKGFNCSKFSVGNDMQKVCLVAVNQNCENMKLCEVGHVCNKRTNKCELCETNKYPVLRSENLLQEVLMRGMTCLELKNGIKDNL